MRNYEITFIVDPVLSGDEIKATAQTYLDMLTKEGCEIIAKEELGLKQLAYGINKRHSGVYYSVEFKAENGAVIPGAELALTRDERIMRFLTVKLDRYGVKYNDDKRNGLIGKVKKKTDESAETKKESHKRAPKPKPAPAPVAKKEESQEEE